MTRPLDSLREGYARALLDYLRRHDETDLSAGYDLGRRALADGLGLLDTTAVHVEVVEQIATSERLDREQLERDAWKFLQEVISSYEMTLHGYREANAELARANQELAARAEEIAVVNKELEAFNYSVAHDLRAPLRRIDGFARALEEDCALDAAGVGHLNRIREAAVKMNKLIEDLLTLSKVGRTELRRSTVDLSEIARRIVVQLQADDPARTVTVEIEPSITAEADAGLVEHLLTNLLGNAWKFTAKRSDARITFKRQILDGVATFIVDDNGIGFDMRYAGQLFQPFLRLQSSFPGTGIGLAIVERIVQRHGGRIWATAEPGRGATFHFTLSRA